MKTDFVTCLQRCESELSNDVVYDDIAPRLIQENVVTVEEHQNIVDLPSELDKTRHLILTVSTKPDDVFFTLVNILWKDYSWLAEALMRQNESKDETDLALVSEQVQSCEEELERKETQCARNSLKSKRKRKLIGKLVNVKRQSKEHDNPTNNQNKKLAITNDMIKVVRRNYRVSKGWTSLAHSLGLSSHIHSIRVKVNTYDEAEDVCVAYLLREWLGQQPRAATLRNLLQALRDDGFNDVADELEVKFC